jgi:hypothetical protein
VAALFILCLFSFALIGIFAKIARINDSLKKPQPRIHHDR